MKKLLSLILVLSMIACLGVIFVACGDSGDSSDGDNNQSTTESNGSSTGSGNDGTNDSTNNGSSDNDGTNDSTNNGSSGNSGTNSSTDGNKPGDDNTDDNKPGDDNTDVNKPGDDNTDDNKPGDDQSGNAPTTSVGSTITEEDWNNMLQADNFAVNLTEFGEESIIYFDGDVVEITDKDGTALYIIKNDVVYYVYMENGEYFGYSTPIDPKFFTIGRYFFSPFSNASFDDLVFNEDTGSYTLSSNEFPLVYELYFQNGKLTTLSAEFDVEPGIALFSQYGEISLTAPDFINTDSDNGDSGDDNTGDDNTGDDNTVDDNVRYTITEEEWYKNMNTNNFSLLMSSGINYDITEDALLLSIGGEANMLIFKQDGIAYYYQIDENGVWALYDKNEEEIGTTIGKMIFGGEYVDILFDSLSFNKEKGCYIYDDYEFYFENGIIVSLNKAYSYYNIGEVVIDISDFDLEAEEDNNDDDVIIDIVGSEITREQWVQMLEMNNFEASVGETRICLGTDAALVEGLYIVYQDGETYGVIDNSDGSYVGISGFPMDISLGSLVLMDTLSAVSVDELYFNDETGAYSAEVFYSDQYITFEFYFVDGVIAVINMVDEHASSPLTINNIGTTTVDVPDFEILQ